MELQRYVDQVRQQLATAAEAGAEEHRVIAERLIAAADPAVRLAMLDAIGDAAAEITTDLAPGSVEVRLRGTDPSFVVSVPSAEPTPLAEERPVFDTPPTPSVDADDEELARINVRMPKQLKGRVERAAARDGVSINTWLVRAATAAAERDNAPPSASGRKSMRGGQRFTGWVR